MGSRHLVESSGACLTSRLSVADASTFCRCQTIWIYNPCYLRFCSVPFTLDNLSNRFVHLSNNSIQKNSSTFDASDIEGNMWHAAQFAEWLQARNAEGAWDGLQYVPDPAAQRGNCNEAPDAELPPRPISSCASVWEDALLPQLRRIITWSLQAAQDRLVARPRSFQIYGMRVWGRTLGQYDSHEYLVLPQASIS